MLVGKIISQNNGLQRFDGYADEAATKKKIAYDVFQRGDSVFMTGKQQMNAMQIILSIVSLVEVDLTFLVQLGSIFSYLPFYTATVE